MLQLLVPFIAGQLSRPWLLAFVQRHRRLLTFSDRSSIILVVYVAFSKAVIEGLWSKVPLSSLGVLVAIDAALLGFVLLVALGGSKLFGFSRRDEIAVMFCGAQKSLVSGVPMANVLFAGPIVGAPVRGGAGGQRRAGGNSRSRLTCDTALHPSRARSRLISCDRMSMAWWMPASPPMVAA
jgi:sodium/bile acid cotransporter 7